MIRKSNCILKEITCICLTGAYDKLTREELESLLIERGYKIVTVPNKSTLILCKDKDKISAKMKSALKSGLPIQTYEEFFLE